MAKIITLVNQKGGVGKTTSAINLSTYLTMAKKRVLLIDLDPQGNASSGLGLDTRNLKKSLYHPLVNGDPIQSIIIPGQSRRPDIAPADQELAGAGMELAQFDHREFRLLEILQPLHSLYDFIIIDSPPSLGLLTINGLVASQEVIVPVQTEYFALEGLGQLINTIELVKENLQPNLKIGGILLTMYDRRNRLSRQVVKEVREFFAGYVFDSVIPRTVRLAEAPSFGKSIFHFDSFNKGARAYRQLAEEVIKRSERIV